METIDNLSFHIKLANYFANKTLYLDEPTQKKPNTRKLVEQPWQELEAAKIVEKQFEIDSKIKEEREKHWNNVTNTLCNLDFIQAKAAAKMTYELVNDFNEVLEVIPDNAVNIRQEKERHARMKKYSRDLISYTKGKINVLEVPESITPWPQEKIDSEIERIKNKPNRIDKLKDFIDFLGQEAVNLQSLAFEFNHFAYQQAWNYTSEGHVGRAAEKGLPEIYKFLLLRQQRNRPQLNRSHQLLKTLKGHTGAVTSVSITPDGKSAISGSMDKTCIVWNLKTGEKLHSLIGHTDEITTVSITPDGKLAISGSKDRNCILWNLITGEAIQTLKGHTSQVINVSIAPDGKSAISNSGGSICFIWNLANGEVLQTLKGHKITGRIACFFPNWKRAVSVAGFDFYLWDLITGEELKSFRDTYSIDTAAITLDGEKAFTGSSNSFDNTCILWDMKSGEILQKFKGHNNYAVRAVAITADGKRAISCSNDSTCILWDVATGQALCTLIGHKGSVEAISMTPDGNWAISGSGDNNCILWDLTKSGSFKSLKKSGYSIMSVAVSPDGKRAIFDFFDSNCICSLWDIEKEEVILTLTGHNTNVVAVSMTPDGNRAISGSWDKTCIFWNLKNGTILKSLKGHTFYVNTVSVTSNGEMAVSGSSDQTCIIWNLKKGKIVKIMKGHTGPVEALSVTPDGERAISVSSDKTCILWDLMTGEAIRMFKGHSDTIIAVSISPDGRRAISSSRDNSCIIWDIKSGEVIQSLPQNSCIKRAISFTPDGKQIIYGTEDNSCCLWNIEKGKILAHMITASKISSLAYFPNGIFIGGSYSEISILNASKRLLCPYTPIVTIRQIWDFEKRKYSNPLIDCPLCGLRFSPPSSVLSTIKSISKKNRLKPGQSPCLELPDEARKDKGLLCYCPSCKEILQSNPFVVAKTKKLWWR